MTGRPFCTLLAGPNGSGKSSLYRALEPEGVFINADMLARALKPSNPEAASLSAGRAAIEALDNAINHRHSFVYETTLSSHQSLAVLRRCRAAGYATALAFVMLETVELNLRRIAERVANGGHDIPETVVRRRHASAFEKLPAAIALSDTVLIFDNSGLEPKVLAIIENGLMREVSFDLSFSLHRQVQEIVSVAASRSTETP